MRSGWHVLFYGDESCRISGAWRSANHPSLREAFLHAALLQREGYLLPAIELSDRLLLDETQIIEWIQALKPLERASRFFRVNSTLPNP